MSDLNALFETAQANAKLLAERPDNPTLLKIYGLFKQATAGDNTEKKPSFGDIVARAKWEAWTTRKGLGADEAKQAYVDLIESLR
ncbi:acyl-CoA-binding protein [Variovorax sp. PBL-E5]|uniref:acyl-CoA-binding protein n=1 Tax=Variovorax sp. PBL-E5 TaxID=434014 RepID=UPI001317A70C|nr:acyl-CoA-binding protein [Variovorax sp. PBL-E5]VTU18848.1 Acyl-CoA-binding protein [Variovorax sp. PBL-E5]